MTNRPIDDTMLDRLVDGDLDEPTRRDVLLALESEPDGWRRCALAFLEAQAWRGAIGEIAGQGALERAPVISPPKYRMRVGPSLARAAVLLAAVGLGWGLRGRAEVAPATASPVVARQSLAPVPAPPAPLLAPDGGGPPALTADLVADLEARGYRMETQPAWLVSQTNDPDLPAQVVPLQQVRLHYVGHPVY
jgi:hypothetical protein